MADDAKADLAEALPALEEAVKSLASLTKSSIVEVRSFTKPPPLVQLVLEAVCILKQEKPDWDTVRGGLRIGVLTEGASMGMGHGEAQRASSGGLKVMREACEGSGMKLGHGESGGVHGRHLAAREV